MKIQFSTLAVAVALLSAPACAAENDEVPAEAPQAAPTTETSSSNFNFAIPGEETETAGTSSSGGDFNFSIPGDADGSSEDASGSLGQVELPEGVTIEGVDEVDVSDLTKSD